MPAALQTFTLHRLEHTSLVESVSGRWDLSFDVRFCVSLSIEGVEHFREGGIGDLWRSVNMCQASEFLKLSFIYS